MTKTAKMINDNDNDNDYDKQYDNDNNSKMRFRSTPNHDVGAGAHSEVFAPDDLDAFFDEL